MWKIIYMPVNQAWGIFFGDSCQAILPTKAEAEYILYEIWKYPRDRK